MIKKKQAAVKPAQSSSGELPDSALDKVAGGGQTGAQGGEPMEEVRK